MQPDPAASCRSRLRSRLPMVQLALLSKGCAAATLVRLTKWTAKPPHPYPSPTRGEGRRIRIIPVAALLFGLAVFAHGAAIPAKAALAQVLLERAWSRALSGEAQAKPWPWADAWPVALVEAPRLKARAVVLSEAGGEAMAFAPMLLSQAAEPGAPGVAVIAAHRDTHFRFLKDLQAGDEIRVTTADGVVSSFTAQGGEVVRHDASGIEPLTGGSPRLALVTCWPFDAKMRGPLRYVLWAELA